MSFLKQLLPFMKLCAGIFIALCLFSAYTLNQKGDAHNAMFLVFWAIGISMMLVVAEGNYVSFTSEATH